MHPLTQQILDRFRRTMIACWLLTDKERSHVEVSPEWRLELRGGTRVAVCTLSSPLNQGTKP